MSRTLLIHHLQHKSFVTTDEKLKNIPIFATNLFSYGRIVLITCILAVCGWMQDVENKLQNQQFFTLSILLCWRKVCKFLFACFRLI